jgi:hypothetical protein
LLGFGSGAAIVAQVLGITSVVRDLRVICTAAAIQVIAVVQVVEVIRLVRFLRIGLWEVGRSKSGVM